MKRVHLAGLALAVGVIYSFPNWWWYFTLPGYSIVRGFVLSDNDSVPYAAALNASARGWPLTGPYLRLYENRNLLNPPAVSNWLTNLLLGTLARLTGSLELMAAVALLVSGAATFLLVYLLGRRLALGPRAALAAAGVVCFRYPFYTSLIAAARRLIESRGRIEPVGLLSLLFPGMVNANQLYPNVRWPVPGMVFWSFLLALILSLALLRRLAASPAGRAPSGLIVAAGAAIGLTAYVYFYFWSYGLALLAVLGAGAVLARHIRVASGLAASGLVAMLLAGPLILVGWENRETQVEIGSQHPILSVNSNRRSLPDGLPEIVAVHGMLALAVALTAGGLPAAPASKAWQPRPALPARLRQWLETWWEPGRLGALWLLGLHLTLVLLAVLEWIGPRLEVWHWSKYILDGLTPLTAAWILLRCREMGAPALPSANPTHPNLWRAWGLWLAICFAGAEGLRLAGLLDLENALSMALGVGAVAPAVGLVGRLRPGRGVLLVACVTPIAWYYYHRTVNELSWVALLPLAAGLAFWRPAWLRPAGWAYAALNVLLAVALQGWVRPVMARDFFALPADYSAALQWLNKNAPTDSVVATNGWTSDYLIRSYTPALTLSAPDWWAAGGEKELRRRQLIGLAMYQVPPNGIERLIAERPAAVAEFKANVNERWIGGGDMDELSERQGVFRFSLPEYEAYYALPLERLLTLRRVDYVWVGPWEREVGQRDFRASPALTLVFADGPYQIYQVSPEP